MAQQPYITLNDGRRMPQVGLGVWPITNEAAVPAVVEAIRTGYRLIDTAQSYENEEGVGRGVREAGVPRGEVFITTKLRPRDQGFDEALRAFDASMERLGLDYVDMFLIHWPVPAEDKYSETWKAFVRLREEGRAKSIGVSNFLPEHLDRILAETGVLPAVNQIEIHPLYQQRDVRDYHRQKTIQLQSYSPLGRGAVLGDPAVLAIAEKHGKTPAQVVIRWHMQERLGVIPKSEKPEHIRENFAVLDFDLDSDDMAAVARLDDPAEGKDGDHPAQMNDPF